MLKFKVSLTLKNKLYTPYKTCYKQSNFCVSTKFTKPCKDGHPYGVFLFIPSGPVPCGADKITRNILRIQSTTNLPELSINDLRQGTSLILEGSDHPGP